MTPEKPSSNPRTLPYTDVKAKGAADFYYAINATFRFLLARLGWDGWKRYLADLGWGYYEPVNRQWREGGLPAVAAYWRDFFEAEPGAVVDVTDEGDRVQIHVKECPAIKHLRAGGRPIVPEYCQHCYFVGAARAASAGLTMRLQGGNGTCRHTYAAATVELAPQDLHDIAEARK